MKQNDSGSDSSASNSPSRIRKPSKKRQEKLQTLDKLRKMVGCDKSISNLELLQQIINYIKNLKAMLNDSDEVSDVENLLEQFGFASVKISNSK
uniref:BHLH transcription factor n=1 Tax=Panagrolaimus sp. JU765 TaxID=591449 RepID=A0AC34QTY8_9BILA